MKKISIIFLLTFCVSLLAQQGKSVGKVTFPIGKNYVQSSAQNDWQKVKYNMLVYDSDKIKTSKQSRCEVTFKTRKVMRIGQNSIVEITRDKAGVEEVKMSKGLAWLSIFLPTGKSKLRVRTPSSVCAIRGTVYRLNCDSTQSTYRCYQGSLAVTPFEKDGKTLSDSTFKVGAGEELILVMNFEEYKKMQEKEFEDFKDKEQDDFERFMQEEQKEFDDMIKQDLADFKTINEMGFKQTSFDKKEDAKSDWVQWNKQRDSQIERDE